VAPFGNELTRIRAGFLDGAESDINQDLHFSQTVPQDSLRTAELSEQENIWKSAQSDWSGASPNVENSPQLHMDPKLSGLVRNQEKLVFKESPAPSPCSTTVQPLEVCLPQGRDSGNKFTVASVLSPQAPSEAATRISHIINAEPGSSPVIESNTSKQAGILAADEALTKALKNVLSASIARESSNKETVRSILPNGRPALSSSSDPKSRPAIVSNTHRTDVIKDEGSPPSDAEITVSDAQKVIEEIVKTIHNFGYTLHEDRKEDPNPVPIILNSGSLAGKKSDKQVTCVVCKKFRGRPCELK
jgi:hypothetical protein